jgi:hypothetical protein
MTQLSAPGNNKSGSHHFIIIFALFPSGGKDNAKVALCAAVQEKSSFHLRRGCCFCTYYMLRIAIAGSGNESINYQLICASSERRRLW